MLLSLAVSAQSREQRQGRFIQDMEAFIAREASLTQAEQQKIFPLFEEMMKKQRVYFERMKRLRRSNISGDKEAKTVIVQCDEAELQIKRIQQSYHSKFLKVLPAKRVLSVLKAEDKFHRQAFRAMAGDKRHNHWNKGNKR